MEMEFETVIVEKKDLIATVSLNRPQKQNSINPAMKDELEQALRHLWNDPEARVVIITGVEVPGKKKVFSAGDDLRDPGYAHLSPDINYEYYKAVSKVVELFNLIDHYPKPIIAMANGVCMAGGLELALACDFIVASEETEFRFNELNIGIIPSWGGTQRLARRIGESKAKLMILTAESVFGKEAQEMGLADILAPQGKLLEVTWELAAKLAQQSPLMVMLSKIAIEKGLEGTVGSGQVYETLGSLIAFRSQDMMEGITAFVEKRKPNFTGR